MQNDKFQENLSRPGVIDAAARHRAPARRLTNTSLKVKELLKSEPHLNVLFLLKIKRIF